MATIKDFLDKVTAIDNQKDLIFLDAILATQNELTEVNKQQLLDGEDKKGNRTARIKTDRYALKKRDYSGFDNRTNRMFRYYNMHYTGTLFSRMYVEPMGSSVAIRSRGDVFLAYERVYPEYFGINPNTEHISSYRTLFLYPEITKRVKNALNI